MSVNVNLSGLQNTTANAASALDIDSIKPAVAVDQTPADIHVKVDPIAEATVNLPDLHLVGDVSAAVSDFSANLLDINLDLGGISTRDGTVTVGGTQLDAFGALHLDTPDDIHVKVDPLLDAKVDLPDSLDIFADVSATLGDTSANLLDINLDLGGISTSDGTVTVGGTQLDAFGALHLDTPDDIHVKVDPLLDAKVDLPDSLDIFADVSAAVSDFSANLPDINLDLGGISTSNGTVTVGGTQLDAVGALHLDTPDDIHVKVDPLLDAKVDLPDSLDVLADVSATLGDITANLPHINLDLNGISTNNGTVTVGGTQLDAVGALHLDTPDDIHVKVDPLLDAKVDLPDSLDVLANVSADLGGIFADLGNINVNIGDITGGIDHITGGIDHITAGIGNISADVDILTGGGANNSFCFNSASDSDLISTFELGNDPLLTASLSLDPLSINIDSSLLSSLNQVQSNLIPVKNDCWF